MSTHDAHCDSLDDFWARLQPHAWGCRSDWLFRGVSNASYGLLPSALRDTERTNEVLGPLGRRQTHAEQVRAERRALRQFYAYADAQGLPVLAGGPWMHGEPIDRDVPEEESGQTRWPLDALLPLCTLAQHHGVPTRLLDWSRKPLVAAYFAASTETKDHENQRMAVWALRHRDGRRSLLDGFKIHVFSAPRFGNTNLHLQSGKVTLHDYRGATASAPGLDQVLGAHEHGGAPLLVKLTLPVSLRSALFQRLADHFIHAAAIYSGYDGVARAVRERARYRP